MKLDPDMYHPNTFNIPKNEGVKNGQVWGGGGGWWGGAQPKNHQRMT